MLIRKCDICKKEIKRENFSLNLRNERFDSFELCSKCSEPMVKFLKNKKLLTNEKRK